MALNGALRKIESSSRGSQRKNGRSDWQVKLIRLEKASSLKTLTLSIVKRILPIHLSVAW